MSHNIEGMALLFASESLSKGGDGIVLSECIEPVEEAITMWVFGRPAHSVYERL